MTVGTAAAPAPLLALEGISKSFRGSGGVTVFRVEGGERVVAVERIEETSGEAGA